MAKKRRAKFKGKTICPFHIVHKYTPCSSPASSLNPRSELTGFHVSSSLNDKYRIEQDALSCNAVGRVMLLARVMWRRIGPGDAPRHLGCNCGGALAVSEEEKLQLIDEKPDEQKQKAKLMAEQANGGYGVELSDGFDEGEQSGHKMVSPVGAKSKI
ncbi:hypothetical protein DY000_02060108 [Brassica cretica]|uniref:Uncharacterized protein n=1 Tax=Brassica cretica TaxID=69181 RepID=A0ABQ7B451_BRACR|nr:hypothetical protein DY000_02060108 [Brassica cretica]